MNITIPYQVILKRLFDCSFNGRLEVGRARKVLIFQCRIPKNLATAVFNEMLNNDWIVYENNKYLIVKQKINISLLYRHPGQVKRG